MSSAVSDERMPSFPCSGRCEKPFMPFSSRNAVTPFCRRPGSLSASTTKTSPTLPCVMFITQGSVGDVVAGLAQRQHDEDVADAALRDEHLGTVQDPALVLAHRRRAHAGRVAAAARLG